MTPFLDGFSTCRAMRELPGGKDVSIVMVTNTDDVDSLQFGYEAGATDFRYQARQRHAPAAPDEVHAEERELASELRRSERKVAKHAYYDALTGLANRRSLEQFLKGLMDRAHTGERARASGPARSSSSTLTGSSASTTRSATRPATSCSARSRSE